MNGQLSGKTNLIAVSQLPAGVYFLQIAAPDVKPLKILIRN